MFDKSKLAVQSHKVKMPWYHIIVFHQRTNKNKSTCSLPIRQADVWNWKYAHTSNEMLNDSEK